MRRGTNMSKLKIASLQMNVLQDKYDNIEQLAEILADGRTEGADIISLAEMWCCPYKTELFPEYKLDNILKGLYEEGYFFKISNGYYITGYNFVK